MQPIVTCFGEVLLDVFPRHQKIGGAPLNVAVRMASFGNKVSIISAIGHDTHGNNITHFLNEQGVATNYIQTNKQHPTGTVEVLLDAKGSASYTIKFPSAWDFISVTEDTLEQVKASEVFIFGSLAARHNVSRKTLFHFLEHANYKVFDANLRAPFYSKDLLIDLMNKADFIKLNDDELVEIGQYFDMEYNSIEAGMQHISELTNTQHICVTRGDKGAVLLYHNTIYTNKGYKVTVVDTVGAGDSFLATLIHNLLSTKDAQSAIDKACAIGALVAQNQGANPKFSPQYIADFMKSYNL